MEWPARLPPVGGGGVSVSLSKAFLSKKMASGGEIWFSRFFVWLLREKCTIH